jgi:Arc/MetJ-type ribon-helix-helix transcriptional regulator
MTEDDEKTIVNAQITESKKERWEEAIDSDGPYPSMSHLIRVSVEAQLHEDDSGESETPNEVNVDFDMDNLASELDTRFDEVYDRLDRIEASADAQQTSDSSLTNDIIDLIPKLPNRQTAREWIDQRTDASGDLKSEFVDAGDEGRAIASTTRLANYLDEDEGSVRQACYRIGKSGERFWTDRENGETWLFNISNE